MDDDRILSLLDKWLPDRYVTVKDKAVSLELRITWGRVREAVRRSDRYVLLGDTGIIKRAPWS